MDAGRFIVLVPIPVLPRTSVGEALRARAEDLRGRQARGEASEEEAGALAAIDGVLGASDGPAAGGNGRGGGGRPSEAPLLLKVEDVAVLLGVCKNHAYNLVARGEIPSLRIGKSVRVRRDALLAWLDGISAPEEALPAAGRRVRR